MSGCVSKLEEVETKRFCNPMQIYVGKLSRIRNLLKTYLLDLRFESLFQSVVGVLNKKWSSVSKQKLFMSFLPLKGLMYVINYLKGLMFLNEIRDIEL